MTLAGNDDSQGQVGVLRRIAGVLLFGVAIGTIASLVSIAFVEAIYWLNDRLFVTIRSRQAIADGSALVHWLFLIPAVGGLVVGLLVRFTAQRRPQTPADLIEATQRRQSLPLRDGLVSATAALLGMGSGASLGQYGPLAQLGATLGSFVSRHSRLDPVIGIACGVAAAISTAFNAPIAGIIFTHEVILRHYSLRAFAPVTVASSTGFFISSKIMERPVILGVGEVEKVFVPEFFAFVLIGISGALVAVLLMQTIMLFRRTAVAMKLPGFLQPAIAGLCIGILAQWVPEILGIGFETFRAAITPGAYDIPGLLVVLAAKILATALCMGFGFAGGAFSPALLIGILFGAIVGNGAEILYGDINSGLEFYAICGMVAVTSPVIGAPLTTILIVFELTRNYELTTAVMVSVVFSNLVAYRIFGRSLFDRLLLQRGIDLSGGRDRLILEQTRVDEYLVQASVVADAGASLADTRRRLVAAGSSEACVVDGSRRYLGVLTLNRILELEEPAGMAPVTDAGRAREQTLSFNSGMTIWEAMEAMRDFVGESIPVVDGEGVLLGIVYESTLVKAYLDMVHQLRAEENAAH